MSDKLGPTGEFPDGKLNPDDDGELRLAVGLDKENNLIHIDFGTEVKWLSLNKKLAFELAEALMAKAKDLSD